MRKATILQFIAHRRRLVGVALAIMISVGFMTMTLLFGSVIDQSFRSSVGAEFRHVDFVVEAGDTSLSSQDLDAISRIEGVVDVQPAPAVWLTIDAHGRSVSVAVAELPDPGALRDAQELTSGRLPEGPGEIVLDRRIVSELRAETGETITIMEPNPESTTGELEPRSFTLVGTWSGEGRFGPDEYGGYLHPDDHQLWTESLWIPSIYVVMAPEANPGEVERALLEVSPGAGVVTAEQKIDEELGKWTETSTVQKLGVNAFAVLALAIAGIVVSNTFAILVSQRTKDIALFRLAGATAGQVRNMVLTEAVLVGLVAAAFGVTGAVLLANIALWGIDRWFDFASVPAGVGISPGMVITMLLAGTIVAVVAAWAPARTATGIDPLRALRASHSPVGFGQRSGAVRTGIALLLLAGGVMLLLGGAAISYSGSRGMGIAIGMVGGISTFLGVLTGASVLVPAVFSAFGRTTAGIGGVAVRVASSNCVRNPRRTTATTISLVIGVALVTMMSVGAETLKATMVNEIDVKAPWDIDVATTGEADDRQAFDAMTGTARTLDGVAALVSLAWIEVEIPGNEDRESVAVEARVVDPAELTAVWRDESSVEEFGAGTALVPGGAMESMGIGDGDMLTLVAGGEELEVRAIANESFDSIMIAEQDVAGLDAPPVADAFWLRLDDDADTDAVINNLYDLASERGLTITLDGTSSYRESLTTALDALLLVITALLGVAVLIAIIGVGNTLTLSVIERTRESALLRALGFTRRQLRQTLAIEGALLAVIGSLIGIALGTMFGWIGAITVVGNAWPIALDFPIGRIAIVLLGAIACGLVASILPARRAAQADPIAALAEV